MESSIRNQDGKKIPLLPFFDFSFSLKLKKDYKKQDSVFLSPFSFTKSKNSK